MDSPCLSELRRIEYFPKDAYLVYQICILVERSPSPHPIGSLQIQLASIVSMHPGASVARQPFVSRPYLRYLARGL